MSSQAVITDKDTLPGSSLGNKVIRKTIHNFHDKEFEVSLLKREYISVPVHAMRTVILLKVD